MVVSGNVGKRPDIDILAGLEAGISAEIGAVQHRIDKSCAAGRDSPCSRAYR
jgi:hypothetical protein